jgi:hypothetical protein
MSIMNVIEGDFTVVGRRYRVKVFDVYGKGPNEPIIFFEAKLIKEMPNEEGDHVFTFDNGVEITDFIWSDNVQVDLMELPT